jgi:hypothetical protein
VNPAPSAANIARRSRPGPHEHTPAATFTDHQRHGTARHGTARLTRLRQERTASPPTRRSRRSSVSGGRSFWSAWPLQVWLDVDRATQRTVRTMRLIAPVARHDPSERVGVGPVSVAFGGILDGVGEFPMCSPDSDDERDNDDQRTSDQQPRAQPGQAFHSMVTTLASQRCGTLPESSCWRSSVRRPGRVRHRRGTGRLDPVA